MTTWRRLLATTFRGPAARAVAGALDRLADAPANVFAVLTYHRVDEPTARPWLNPHLLSATPSTFEAQMVVLARRYHPIGMPELLAAHRWGRSLPRRAVLVTFDDGYRDFRGHAWPILRRSGIPATLFVPTAYPDAGRPFWWDRLWRAVMEAPGGPIDTPAGSFELRSPDARRRAARALVEHHKRLPHHEALRSVGRLTDHLAAGESGAEVLSWDDLRALAAEGVHIAPHSRTHPLLTRLPPDELAEEVRGSQVELRAQLGDAATTSVFAYPGGQHDSRTRATLVGSDVELAFTTARGVNQVGRSDRLRLRRINVGLRSGAELIHAQVALYTVPYRIRRD